MLFTEEDLTRDISRLLLNKTYPYLNPGNRRRIRIVEAGKSGSPIRYLRTEKGRRARRDGKDVESISWSSLADLAVALEPNVAVNVDDVLRSSGNSRSVLESLAALTPEIHVCYVPSKKGGRPKRHIVRIPESRHPIGIVNEVAFDPAIGIRPASRGSSVAALAGGMLPGHASDRTHAVMQAALAYIGARFGYRTHVAADNRGNHVGGMRLDDHNGVVCELGTDGLFRGYPEAAEAALLVDAVWLSNDRRRLPMLFEIEHSTGVTSGLSRMSGVAQALPKGVDVRWIIVAHDDEERKVMREIRRPQFSTLGARYLPYSRVSELYGLCVRYPMIGTDADFISNFLVEASAV